MKIFDHQVDAIPVLADQLFQRVEVPLARWIIANCRQKCKHLGRRIVHFAHRSPLPDGSLNAFHELFANRTKRVMYPAYRPPEIGRNLGHPSVFAIAAHQQFTLLRRQLVDAARQGCLASLDLVWRRIDLCLGDLFGECVAESSPITAMLLQKVVRLETRHAVRPGQKAAIRIELLKMFPQGEACLLKHILRIVNVPHQREDVTHQLRLTPLQVFGERL